MFCQYFIEVIDKDKKMAENSASAAQSSKDILYHNLLTARKKIKLRGRSAFLPGRKIKIRA